MKKKQKHRPRKRKGRNHRSLWFAVGSVLLFLVAAVSILLYFEVHRESFSHWVGAGKDHARRRISSVEQDEVTKQFDRYLDGLLKEYHVARKNIRIQKTLAKGPQGTFLSKRIEVGLPRKEAVSGFEKKLYHYARQFPGVSLRTRRKLAGKQERTILSLSTGKTIMRRVILVSLSPIVTAGEKISGPRVAIIVDDIGANLAPLNALIDLDVAITFSVLPDLRHSKEAVREITDHHRELMLHLPMEPVDYPKHRPGSDALLVKMGKQEIRKRVRRLLDLYPEIAGVNNHMGSRFTQDRDRMAVVLEEIKKRNLFFVDSLTSNRSVAYDEAKRLGIAAARRNIFLDNVVRSDAVGKQIDHLIKEAQAQGSVIAICHPHAATLKALRDALGRFRAAGIKIVPVSELIDRS